MGYNSAFVKDICEIFVSMGYIIITNYGGVLLMVSTSMTLHDLEHKK